MKNKLFYILLGLLLVIFALDFIPVKKALKDTDITRDNIEYVFCYEPKTLGPEIVNWVTYGYKDSEIHEYEYQFQVSIIGKNPYDYFTELDFEPIDLYNDIGGSNKFVLKGNIQKINGDYQRLDVTIEDWDIIYPINRLSFRNRYVSKKYLTIYDYDWFLVIKDWVKM